LRFRLRTLQLVEARQRHTRRYAREPFAHHRGIDEHAVFAHYVGEMAIVGVEAIAFLLESNPPMQNERPKALPRLEAERRRRVEPAPDLGRIDAEQPHASDACDVDRVAVEHRAHDDRLRSRDAGARQRELKKCNAYRKCRWQNLHSRLRLSWSYRHCERRLQCAHRR
jgi:hypothetical protein